MSDSTIRITRLTKKRKEVGLERPKSVKPPVLQTTCSDQKNNKSMGIKNKELVKFSDARYQMSSANYNVGLGWVRSTPSPSLTDHTAVTDTKTIGFDFCVANPDFRRLLSTRLLRTFHHRTEHKMLDSS